MNELIERLEKATGPDRSLDGDIAQALGLPPPDYERWTTNDRCPARWQKANYCWDAPHYTASIDAALTLVPEGYSATVNTFCWVEVFPNDVTLQADTYAKHVRHFHQPAIALCIAALKARAASITNR